MSMLALRHRSRGTAEIDTRGAQVMSWHPAKDRDVLFIGTGERSADERVRGGIPVVFPQFADTGPLPKHGFAADQEWKAETSRGDAIVLRLRANAATRALWPHEFDLSLLVTLGDGRLEVRMNVRNTGREEIRFTCGLHTYVRVDDITRTTLRGLSGVPFLDKTRDFGQREENTELVIRDWTDRVYLGAPRVELSDERGTFTSVEAVGFENVVVWNPWDRATQFSGLGAEDYRKFVCVEAAHAREPVVLAPNAEWSGTQRLATSD